MGRSKNPRRNFTGDEAITRIPPNIPVSRPLGDFDIGGESRRPRGRRIGRKLSNEEKMRIKEKYQQRRELREKKGFAKRGTFDKKIRPIRERYSSLGEYAQDYGRPAPSDRPPLRKKPFRLPPDFVCPDPNMHILMSDGSEKKAGDLVVGDLVKTYHEESFKLGEYEVEHVDIVNDVEKIKLIFDKSTIVCSLSHKLYVGDSWKEAKEMVIGDEVSGKKLVSIEDVDNGDVIRITVKDAHTYICEGLLSHNKSPRPPRRPIGRRMPPRDRPLTGGYDPKSGVRYTDTGVPTAVQGTERVPVQDPTLGGPPEREVPIPKERRQRITRESDPRGGAPFSPDERGMARDRFFERMFERADERKQQKAMERAERDNVRDALVSERGIRESEMASPGDERGGRRGGGGIRRRRRRGGPRRRRRRRDFTRRFSRAEGGRRGRSGKEMAAFRDRYVDDMGRESFKSKSVSTLR